ncbi:HD domain-containing protein [Caulobacter sp. S45]|uniref:HD domain-containing protein n=1 Tax=Caulobacter sp. S45 TaxID=1641861 RepID=UPI00157646EE|nr:HD domain-containing protein [Caulobacter sp. S45]
MTDIIDEIFELFARFGSDRYGEDLSLESHMLQSAAQADSLKAPRHTVVAALLHDVGHFLSPEGEPATGRGRELDHEAIGAAWLSRGFGEEVTAPIALHVNAKRYLCAVEPGYFDGLSQASRLSLVVQGGVMTRAETATFAEEPAFVAALMLRRCDDTGKDSSGLTRSLADYRDLMETCLRSAA